MAYLLGLFVLEISFAFYSLKYVSRNNQLNVIWNERNSFELVQPIEMEYKIDNSLQLC